MTSTATYILLPILVALLFAFLTVRLRFFAEERVSGRLAFLSGGIVLLFVSIWQAVRQTEAYADWFLTSAYAYLDLGQFLLLLIGLALVVAALALYADYWQMRKEDVDIREQKLSLLDDLQRDARGPYPLLELLNIAIKEVATHMPETAGAIFLLNRKQRQFLLTASVGLNRDETALLEYYPLQRNIVSQSIDLGEPLLSGAFTLVDRSGVSQASRFQSSLVLPLVSGNEKIGAILLVSENDHFFSRSEIRFLQPVAEWLAEKIKSARLERDVSTASKRAESLQRDRSELMSRLREATAAFGAGDGVASFCRSLVGLATARTVHLFGMVNGSLQIYGGSEPLGDLSENYRTALVDALDRQKPLIINQEAVTEAGRAFVAASSLVVPLGERRRSAALLLRRDDGPFTVDDHHLQTLDLLAGMAGLVLQQADTNRISLTRRTGFDAVLQLLRFDRRVHLEDDPGFFLRHLAAILPDQSPSLMFLRQADGSFAAAAGNEIDGAQLDEVEVLPDEGPIGEAASRGECRFAHGRPAVTRALDAFEAVTRDRVLRLFGEHGIPGFMAVCPVQRLDTVAAVAVFTSYGITESERGEWERMLTLATSLFAIRLTIADLNRQAQAAPAEPAVDNELLGETVNELNNHLSAVIGNAELAFTRAGLTEEVEKHLRSIITEAEQAAHSLKDSLVRLRAPVLGGTVRAAEDRSLGDLVESILGRLRVSENVYMVGGRAREINTEMLSHKSVPVGDEKLLGLVEETFNRFGAAADDEDILTVRVYTQGDYVFLDLSRHRKNFPPVQELAGFETYQLPDEILKYRPSDTYLRYTVDTGITYAYDRAGQRPSYVSFRFPAAPGSDLPAGDARRRIRVLAIDDQTVILDLISAMCQSLGYEVMTAPSGSEGIALARIHEFSIILTDLAMPGMSGLEAAGEIRKVQPGVPVVLVTGWEVNIDPARLEAAGITSVLYKPFRIEQLTDIIKSASEISS